jgi:hypothetical protein
VICPSGALLKGVSSPPLQKYFASPVGQIISTSSRHPTPPEGRIAIVTDAGCGSGGRGSVLRATGCRVGDELMSDQQHADERCCCVRRSRVVLTPRRWCQVRGGLVGPTGRRQTISVDDGGKQARSPGRARRKPLKPLRAGTSGDSGVLVVTRVRSINTKCTRGRGCHGHPAFPTPSLGERSSTARAHRAARSRTCV